MRTSCAECQRGTQRPMGKEEVYSLPQVRNPARAWEHVSDVGRKANKWPITSFHGRYLHHGAQLN